VAGRASHHTATDVVNLDSRRQQQREQTPFLTFLIGKILGVNIDDLTVVLKRELVGLLRRWWRVGIYEGVHTHRLSLSWLGRTNPLTSA
jgi:hypothetical protein